MSLKNKERAIHQIQHKETDHIPHTIGFDGNVAEQLDAYYGSRTCRNLIDNAIEKLPIPSNGLLVDENANTFYTDLYGSTWRVDVRPFHLSEPALKLPSLEGYKLPPVAACFDPDWADRATQFVVEHKDHFLVGFFGFGLFERSWAIRGFENAMMDSAANPGFYENLIEQLTQLQMAIIERLLQLPLDGIMFSDDWGYQQAVLLGAKRWCQILKPRLAHRYDLVYAAGKYTLSHCCGSIIEIMPDLIEIGLDVLESMQPEAKGMNPYELKRRFGDQITFWGALGSQSTIQFGTPDEIRLEVSRLCREMGRGGGYILSPAKNLQPGTPVENATAVVEAFMKEQGVKFA